MNTEQIENSSLLSILPVDTGAGAGAIAGLVVGAAVALAILTAIIVLCYFRERRSRKKKKNLEEGESGLTACPTRNRGEGAESWEMNYVPYCGGVSRVSGGVVAINQPGGATEQDEEKWQRCYVPFSPPFPLPPKASEVDNGIKDICQGNEGEDQELDVRDSGAAAYGQPTANERERRTLKQKVKGLQQARHAAKLGLVTEASAVNLTWDSSHEPLETRESSLCLVHTPRARGPPRPHITLNSSESSSHSPAISSGSTTSLAWDDWVAEITQQKVS